MKRYNWTFAYAEGHSLLLNEVFFRAFTDYPEIPGIVDTILYLNEEGYENCYISAEETKRIRDEGKEFFKFDFRHQFQIDIAARAELFDTFWKNVLATDVGSLRSDELFDFFGDYVKNLTLMCAHYQVSGGRVFPVIEEHVKKRLSLYFPAKEVAKNYSLLLSSAEPDVLEREELALLKLSAEPTISDEMLQNHAKEYAFHYLSSYDERRIFQTLRDRIKKLVKAHGTAQEFEAALLAKKRSYEKLRRSRWNC